MSKNPGSRCALAAAFLLTFAAVSSAQLVTENAGTTSPATPTARLLFRASHWQLVDEMSVAAELHYGLHQKLEANISVPVVYRSFEIGNGAMTIAGLGDVRIGAKLNLTKTDGVMTSVRTAVFGSVEVPTGRSHETTPDDSEQLPKKLQLGSGTFDFDLGFAFTWINDRHRFALSAAGRASTSDRGVRPGAEARLDAAYWFRLLPASFETGQSGLELRLVLDASFVWRWRTQGEADDSGGRVWLSPGIQFYATTWLLFEGNIQLPLYDGPHDQYGRARIAGFVALKFLF